MIRSRTQKEASAYRMLQNAYTSGLKDDAAIDFAVAAMGEDSRALIARVHTAEFRIAWP